MVYQKTIDIDIPPTPYPSRRASIIGIVGNPSPNDINFPSTLTPAQSNGSIFMTESSAGLSISSSEEHNKSKRLSFPDLIWGTSLWGNDILEQENIPQPLSIKIPPSESRLSLISIIKRPVRSDETWFKILSQIGLPFLIAGLGMVGAGLLLDRVMDWQVFKEVGELVILVTPLLGLKGNLEMTLASRLSTHANIGNLSKASGKRGKICGGNLVLDQLQAIVCGFVASFIAILVSYIFTQETNLNHVCLVIVSSVLTASMVSLILGSTMISVVLLSERFNINPDNVATPVAGSLGDVVTLSMLSCFASVLYTWQNQGFLWVPYVLISFYLICLPITFFVAFRNEYTKQVTISGWIPLLVSVCISTCGGIILDIATPIFDGLALYQPVINGIGGNLVSVQASRISSYLHENCEKRVLPNKGPVCDSPFAVFFGKGINSMSARLLLCLAIPGHLLFSTVTHFAGNDQSTNFGVLFLAFYVSAAVLQVSILLYIAKILTNLCWSRGVDPDTATIPYLTALGDLFGTGFLFIAFVLLREINSENV